MGLKGGTMTVKEVLNLVAEYIGDTDLKNCTELGGETVATEQQLEKLNLLLSCVNDVSQSLAMMYFPLKFEEKSFNGGKIVHNKEINRIQFLFASIPNEDIRKLLKANGFHWSKKEQAWQREFNQNCIRATERIEKKIKELEKQEDEELE